MVYVKIDFIHRSGIQESAPIFSAASLLSGLQPCLDPHIDLSDLNNGHLLLNLAYPPKLSLIAGQISTVCCKSRKFDYSKFCKVRKSFLVHFQGPAMFHRSAMLFYASHLLSSAPSNHQSGFMTSQYDLLPLNVTLGGIDTQLSQLSDFTRHLWKHAGVLTTERLSLG